MIRTAARNDKRLILFFSLLLIASATLADNALYTVKKGDRLISILQAHGFKPNHKDIYPFVAKTVELNKEHFATRSADYLIPGTELRLPENPFKKPVAAPEPVPAPPPKPEPVAPATIGYITLEKGEAYIYRNNEKQLTKTQKTLYAGDIIETSTNSIANINLIDDSQFNLGPATKFEIVNYHFPKNSADSNIDQNKKNISITHLFHGAVKSITGLIGKKDKKAYQFSTPIATIGIRGTEFITRFCQGNYCGDLSGTSVAVIQGSINLKNDTHEASLEKGEFSQLEDKTSKIIKTAIPEGFLDLERDTTSLEVNKSFWQWLIDIFKRFTH